jgi:hypothetical protein
MVTGKGAKSYQHRYHPAQAQVLSWRKPAVSHAGTKWRFPFGRGASRPGENPAQAPNPI